MLKNIDSYISATYLLWQQEVCEDLHAGVWVHVGVELHEGLGLVVREPDGGDGLELDAGDGQVRHAVT